jgi:hypothetical protein
MSLITQRKQTSQAVAELWHNTFFNRYWRAIGGFLGRDKEVPVSVSAAVVMALSWMLGVSISFLLRESQFLSTQVVLTNLMWMGYTYFVILLAIANHSKLLDFVRLHLIASMKTEKDIRDLQAWAQQWLGRNVREVLFSVVFAAALTPVGYYSLYSQGHFSLGIAVFYFFNYFHLSASVYGLFSVIVFLSRLKDWQLTLYPDDPGSTPILLQLSAQLRNYLLVFSFGAALFMVLARLVSELNIFSIVGFLIVAWLPVLALFFLTHLSISGMITRVKQERMGEIQAQIMKLSRQGKTDTQVTAQILSLMNYHDRVKGARNSLVNSQAILNLLGSLALPAIATLIQAYVKGLFS